MSILKKALMLPLFISLPAFANAEIEKLVLDYKAALNAQDKDKIQKLVTTQHYQSLTKDGLLERLFKQTQKDTRGAKKYQVEVIESKVVKGAIMARAQEVGEKHDHNDHQDHKDWLKIKKTEKGYLIEEEVHMD